MTDGATSGRMWEKIFLVLVGAICGVIPVLVTQQLQSHVQMKQQVLDRQLAIVREYGSACSKIVSTFDQLIIYYSLSDLGGLKNFEFKDFQKSLVDYQAATNEQYVTGVIAEALFGKNMVSPLKSIAAEVTQGLKLAFYAKMDNPQAIQDIMGEAPNVMQAMADECHENMKIMQSEITERIKN